MPFVVEQHLSENGSVRLPTFMDALRIQEKIFSAEEILAQALREKELPDGIDALATFSYSSYPLVESHKSFFFRHKRLGYMIFPDITIATNYGSSNIEFEPHRRRLDINVYDGGIAEEIVLAKLSDIERVLEAPVSSLITYMARALERPEGFANPSCYIQIRMPDLETTALLS